MKEKIQENLVKILDDLYGKELIIDELPVTLQENSDKNHGDLASNIALILAKPLKTNPQVIANDIKDAFINDDISTSHSPSVIETTPPISLISSQNLVENSFLVFN